MVKGEKSKCFQQLLEDWLLDCALVTFMRNIKNGTKEFRVPQSYPLNTPNSRVDDDGNKYITLGNTCWFTNKEHKRRNEELALCAKYNKDDHPTYDNYNAINVDKVRDIPRDYDGIMGVPISFLDKYNPEQFEIIGSDYEVYMGLLPELIKQGWTGKLNRGIINGQTLYARILIKRKK